MVFATWLAASARPAVAGTFTLVDGNSTAVFDTNSLQNQIDWTIDGQDQIFSQAFWYRIGNTSREFSVSSLAHPVEGVTDTNFDGSPDTLFVRYLGTGFNVETRYVLDGGTPGSGASDLGEQISIVNTGNTPLDFHFFQYVDFDLGDTASGDTALFTNANAVRQFEGPMHLTETVVTPPASHREINFFPVIFDKLEDPFPTTLSDSPPTGVALGPGDMTWSYQWDVVIPVGGTFQISKDKNFIGIPEPATVLLLSIAGLLPFRRRK